MLFHLVAIFVLAFPAPVGGADRNNWKVKSVQQDFEAWSKFLHVDQVWFEDFIFELTVGWLRGREVVVTPFGHYVRFTGCDQPWRMFVGPTRAPARLQVQALKLGAQHDQWETLFEERSPTARWHESLFMQERLRSQISRWPWPSYLGEYELGCAWISRLAFSERPDVEYVRCRFRSAPTPTPQEAAAGVTPPVEWVHERRHRRGEP